MDVTKQRKTPAVRLGAWPWCAAGTSMERDLIALVGVAGSRGAEGLDSSLVHFRAGEGFPSQLEVLEIGRS